MTINSDSPAGDLSRLRVDRDAAPRRRWLPWAILVVLCAAAAGTTNFSSFSEVAFKFKITPALLAGGLLFSAVMGAVGGLLPAIRAARIPVARALREI